METENTEKMVTTLSTDANQQSEPNQAVLHIDIKNGFVTLDTHSYDHCRGNRTNFAIFNLTSEQIIELGKSIIVTGLEIAEKQRRLEAEKHSDGEEK